MFQVHQWRVTLEISRTSLQMTTVFRPVSWLKGLCKSYLCHIQIITKYQCSSPPKILGGLGLRVVLFRCVSNSSTRCVSKESLLKKLLIWDISEYFKISRFFLQMYVSVQNDKYYWMICTDWYAYQNVMHLWVISAYKS